MRLKNALKAIASQLPKTWQNELKRRQFAREIRKGQFQTDEKEYNLLSSWVSENDWVIDVGANIGHYTAKLSELVGSQGRVVAFEPVPATFELLAANSTRFSHRNITLMNIAASDSTAILGMEIPKFDSGLDNYYMANITSGESSLNIMTIPIDNLHLHTRVSFVKIDAEGHELSVLKGMQQLIKRDKPVVLAEDNSREIEVFMKKFNYDSRVLHSSSNRIFEPRSGTS